MKIENLEINARMSGVDKAIDNGNPVYAIVNNGELMLASQQDIDTLDEEMDDYVIHGVVNCSE